MDAQRIVTPFFIGLAERRHRQLDAMEKITSAARREFSFPSPVDVHGERGDEQNNNGNDERQAGASKHQTVERRLPARESFRSISRKF